MKKVLLLLMILFLSSCAKPLDYSAPANISYAHNSITWTPIEDATSYKVIVNADEIVLEQPFYDVTYLQNGTYDITVISVYVDGTQMSTPFQFTINRIYESPTNLSVSNSILSFESSYLTTYELYIDDMLITSFEQTSIDISNYTQLINTYEIKVVALYNNISYASDIYYYHTYPRLDIDRTLTYELRSDTELMFTFDSLDQITYILKNDTTVDDSLYTSTETSLTFDKDIFFYPTYGENIFEVYTSSGYFFITINVIETERPHLLTHPSIDYLPNNNIILEFNLLEGSFIKLDGNDITNQDYTYEDETVTINASYIEYLLEIDPDRTTIILSYQLEKDQNSYTGLIFIYIN